jgi:hypothetical protein
MLCREYELSWLHFPAPPFTLMKCNRGFILVQQASNSTTGPRGTEIVHGLFMGFGVRFFFVTVVESYISYSQGLSSNDSFTSCSWDSVTVVYHTDTGFSFSSYLIWQFLCLSALFTETTSGFPVARLRIPFPAKGSQAMWRRLHLLVIKVFPFLTTLNCVLAEIWSLWFWVLDFIVGLIVCSCLAEACKTELYFQWSRILLAAGVKGDNCLTFHYEKLGTET